MKQKAIIIIISIVLFVGQTMADNLVFDYKYVKVGVITNDWDNQLGNNPNIRNLGTTTKSEVGKQVLDKLLNKDAYGKLHIEQLWNDALSNTILEEEEIAELDASASKNDVLKKDISRQILKTNYVIILERKEKKSQLGTFMGGFAEGFTGKDLETRSYDYIWKVYHIEITDDIIDQAYLNWNNPTGYNQIKVPVKLVAKGKCKPKNLIFSIAKKVPAFAVRGTIASLHPTMANINKNQGIRKVDLVNIYGVYEDANGNLISKQKGTTRATVPNDTTTRLFSVGGRTPSLKNGDIAVLRSRQRSAFTLLGQASFGNDPRYGGRLLYDYMLAFSKHGIAQYFLFSANYNTFKKEPAGYWWQEIGDNEYRNVTPRLSNFDASIGYGVGFNFLNCLELRPYILLGWETKFSSISGNIIYWESEKMLLTVNPTEPDIGGWERNDSWGKMDFMNFIGYAGAQLNITIAYPFQFVLGADYNIGYHFEKQKIYDCHQQNRLNLYAGFRLNF